MDGELLTVRWKASVGAPGRGVRLWPPLGKVVVEALAAGSPQPHSRCLSRPGAVHRVMNEKDGRPLRAAAEQ